MRKPTIGPQTPFNKPPPGYSLTQAPGKWPWEKPPKYSTAPAAVDAIIDNLEKPEIQEHYVQLLAAGVSAEELVETMVRLGFTEGLYTVDVAELVKTPLLMYLMGLATDAGVPARVFNTRDGMPRTNYGMKDAQILNIMRRKNPDFARYITQQYPQEIAQERAFEQAKDVSIQQESFLGVEDTGETEE